MQRIDGKELQKILQIAGRTQADFMRFINYSKSSFGNKFLYKTGYIPVFYQKKLEDFLGRDVYNESFKEMNKLQKNEHT